MDLELKLSSKLIWYVLPAILLTKSDEMVKYLRVVFHLSVHFNVSFFYRKRGNLALTNVSLRVLHFQKLTKSFAAKTILHSVFRYRSEYIGSKSHDQGDAFRISR